MRPLPELTPANRWFWTSGADGRLRVQGCDDFLEWLDRHRRDRQRPQAATPEKRDKLTEAEMRSWLDEFAGLADDPQFKELFEPFPFEEDG